MVDRHLSLSVIGYTIVLVAHLLLVREVGIEARHPLLDRHEAACPRLRLLRFVLALLVLVEEHAAVAARSLATRQSIDVRGPLRCTRQAA